MNFEELLQAADSAMGEVLTRANFRKMAPGLWNRRRGNELNVVQLQKHSTEQSFCVNFGIHYAFLPKAGTEAPLHDDLMELPDCEVKLRLTEHLVKRHRMVWYAVEDECGRSLGVAHRGKDGAQTWSYPVDAIAKRVDQEETGFISGILEAVGNEIERG